MSCLNRINEILKWFENHGLMLHGNKRTSVLNKAASLREEILSLLLEHRRELSCSDLPIETILSRLEELFVDLRQAHSRDLLTESHCSHPPAACTVTTDFCPSFCGRHAVTRPGWATVCEMIEFCGDVKAWIKKKGVWALNGADERSSGVKVLRATCKFGGNAVKEKKKGAARGFGSDIRFPDFRPCGCQLRVIHSTGWILKIEVSVNSDGESHTHGDVRDEFVGKGTMRLAVKIDPSMTLHNILMSSISASHRPGAILSASQQQVVRLSSS
jgi:hypothetical protein